MGFEIPYMPQNGNLHKIPGPRQCPTKPTCYLRRYKIETMEQYLKFIEPKELKLQSELKYLAHYLVKVGPNVELAVKWSMQGVKYPDVDIHKIASLVRKYDLTWELQCERSELDTEGKKYLFHVALAYPKLFIDRAAKTTPGNFDVRRFWWCANNGEFLSKDAKSVLIEPQTRLKQSPSRLLSDILPILLTPNEPKLATLCALRSTVSERGNLISKTSFRKNMNLIMYIIKAINWGESNPELKESLRIRYNIEEAEAELKPISIDAFVQWWNLTGLRKDDSVQNAIVAQVAPVPKPIETEEVKTKTKRKRRRSKKPIESTSVLI